MPADDPATLRRNWWLHVLEAGIGLGAMNAINSNTVGTALIQRLGGAAWMVALAPMLMVIGFSLGPLFNAHHLERQERFLPTLRRSIPWSRLSLLAIAGSLWFSGEGHLSLAIVLVGYLWFGLIGGLGVGAWQQLVAKTIPPERRTGLFATRYLLANVLGIGAGALVTAVLAHWPGLTGYALLHLIAFAGWVASFHLVSQIREQTKPPPPLPPDHGFLANLRSIPGLFAQDARLRWYLVSSVLGSSQFLLIGFLAVHARQVLQAPESYIGSLTTAQMVGSVLGTLFAAWRGNHHGSRALVIASRLLFLITALGAMVADTSWAFLILFAGYGAAFWMNLVGNNALILEIMPATRRSTVLAVFGAVTVPSMLVAAQLGGVLWQAQVSFAWIAGISAVGTLLALVTVLPIRSKTT